VISSTDYVRWATYWRDAFRRAGPSGPLWYAQDVQQIIECLDELARVKQAELDLRCRVDDAKRAATV
jgi:hypothetical protein